MTTARAVKLAGGVPIMLTETVPVETSLEETTCGREVGGQADEDAGQQSVRNQRETHG
jgi:hypothetical protein